MVIEQVHIMSLKSGGGLTRGRGMPKSVQQQWLYSTQACAAIHDVMTSLPLIQHVEFGEARHLHDLRDMNEFIDWFGSHDPCDGNVP